MSLLSSLHHSKAQPLTEREFADFIERQQRPMLQLAMRLVGNWEEARDLAQSAFVRLWQRRQNMDTGREPIFYLRRILVNLCIDHLRWRGARAPHLEFNEAQYSPRQASPQDHLENNEMQNWLLQAIDALAPKQKATLILRDLEGFSVAETALTLSCSQNSVLTNLHLARKNVKEKMQQWFAAQE